MTKSGRRTKAPVKRTKSRQTLRANFSAMLSRHLSAIFGLTITIAGLALLLMSTGAYVPLFGAIFGSHANVQPVKKASATVSAPNTALAATICSRTEQKDTLFAKCPSFLVDYSQQQSGVLNPYEFNIYTGQPIANGEAQYYTDLPANVRIQNGSLWLEAQTQAYKNYTYTSARIDTHGKEDFLYGKLVIRAKLPSGIGTWPAIWMLPSQPKYASLSPETDLDRFKNDGEIDIAESIGLQPHIVYGVAHSLAYPEDGVDRSYYSTILVPHNDRNFHDYEVDWTATSLTFRIDSQAFYTYHKQPHADWRSWPFDQPFYLIINLALGGSWAGSDTVDFPGDGINKAALPAALQVQSIHYYSLANRQGVSSSPVMNR